MPRGRPCWSSKASRKSFGRVVVADNLSFTIAGGDIVGIVGPNGAGKTSLFGLIAGDLAPTSGAIRFDGVPVTGWARPPGAGWGSAGPSRCRGRSGR